ncbi:hypothetical protein CYY_006532 [Polysphondylium violaceum]|uniref:Ankyrin repeat-containing protein n=1 Tax=Polysphondylium violaceum TaxID=133409 RepID=A0A8J4PS36_9MYCE|nr:hypothetical protein CYY_006532 [Polysphondylium violaceum]
MSASVNNNNNNNINGASPLKTFLNSYEGCIDLNESIEDSPLFRKQLKDTEQSIDELAQNIKKMLKSSKVTCELGNDYNASFKSFVDDLLDYRKDAQVKDDLLERGMLKFSTCLKEICNFRELLHMEMEALISTPLQSFADNDLKHVKEQYKKYDKYSKQYDDSAIKLGQIKKKNSVKIEEVAQEVNESLKLRIQYGLDLVETMNQVQARKRFEFLEYFSVFLHAQSTFFHQGYELFRDLEPHMRVFSNYLQSTRKNYEDQKKRQTMTKADLIEKTFLSTSPPTVSVSGSPVNGGIIFTPNRTSDTLVKRGYLFKRSEYNSFTRKFFSLENGKLSYYRSGNDSSPSHTLDLFLTTVRVREDLDRRNCFELLSPDRSIILQAESLESMQEWIQVLQNATANALNNCTNNNNNNNNSSSNSSKDKDSNNNKSELSTKTRSNTLNSSWGSTNSNSSTQSAPCNSINTGGPPGGGGGGSLSCNNSNNSLPMYIDDPLTALRKIDQSNQFCADCNTKDPDWASINFGCIVCIDCSGIHRSLGVHISKVRSLTLDKWEPELLGMMKCIGNEKVNKIYEELVPSDRRKPTPNDPFDIRCKWIRDKYEKKIFVKDLNKSLEELNSILYHISGESNTSYLLELIAQGGDPNGLDSHHKNRTPLHNACKNNMAQNVCLLVQNGSYTDICDTDGNTPLHVSADSGSSDCCILVLMKSVKLLSLQNKSGKTPLDLAVEKGNIGCVAILRLAQLQRDEGKNTFDETFAEVLRGFSKEK